MSESRAPYTTQRQQRPRRGKRYGGDDIKFTLTLDERNLLDQGASLAGLSLAAFVRGAALREARRVAMEFGVQAGIEESHPNSL